MGEVAGFPSIPDYVGLNAPQGQEYRIDDLEVEGTIPPEVDGTFFRAVPDPAFPPFIPDSAASLSGDGLVSAIRFENGKASIQNKYVDTARHVAEVKAGHALFGKYRNPFTDKPQVQGMDRTVANTTPVWHAGMLLMAKEDGRPYRVDPETLETLGSHDFDGALKSETMTAHVRIDPATGTMYAYGYEADGLASKMISYIVVNPDGSLRSEQMFEAPYCSMMHDFTISENYALFPVYPTTAYLEEMRAGGDHWYHEQDWPSWLGVMPRDGDVADMKWFKGPVGVHSFHMMNSWEDADGMLHFDACLSDSNAFPFIREASGIHLQPWELNGRLARWTVDPKANGGEVTETVIGPPGDMPMIPADRQGRPYSHGWMLTMNPEMQGPPVLGGPVGAMFNVLMRIDMAGGPPRALVLAPNECFNEAVHVPSNEEGHEGYMLTVVDRQTGPDDFEHECWIIPAGDPGQGPVARVTIPRRQRVQIHGWWVSREQLEAAR
ncbi:carotenoid oxygenase family protein [Parerythrobacter aestuarii]|uniref:carotenoid oxygenase family protein n=1 Tax=Parerythrobacter aestuarii TaxID=3020909 RepID=UPI0024DE07C1|nr:carotenoid oxygenase family protein [Parerythrobacter aestuarii]